jgi:hypothetical protein
MPRIHFDVFLQAKIDDEMAKIVVDVGVYLPSNPDGKVIDIDKKSGRPLQSHAKVCRGFCRLLIAKPNFFKGTLHGDLQSKEGTSDY